MDLGLKGRVAIIAASSQGLGRAAAYAFAAEGCSVALCARNEAALSEIAKDLEAKYAVGVHHQSLDVTDEGAVKKFVAAVGEKFGRIDIYVTNAGGPPAKPFLELSMEEWRRAVELNLLSAVSFCREVIPWMQRQKW